MFIIVGQCHKGGRLVIEVATKQPEQTLRTVGNIDVSLRSCGLCRLRGADSCGVTRQRPGVKDDLSVTPRRECPFVEFFGDFVSLLYSTHRRDFSPVGLFA
jgi:hypothetical protein